MQPYPSNRPQLRGRSLHIEIILTLSHSFTRAFAVWALMACAMLWIGGAAPAEEPPGHRVLIPPPPRGPGPKESMEPTLFLLRPDDFALAPGSSTWQPLGPEPLFTAFNGNCSGRITGIAADPTDANTIYIAAATGGVWKTTDGGMTWTPLTDGQTSLNMGDIAIAPSNHLIVYAGTGEPNFSGDCYYGRGILKSTDGGATWTLLTGNSGNNEFDREGIAKIVVHPTDPNTVYVAVHNRCANGIWSQNGGIWKTTDGGTTWTNTTASISTDMPYSDLIMDPTDPTTLYAAIGEQFGSSVNGVYKTTNGGGSWAVAGNYPMGTADGRITLAVSPAAHQTIYSAIVDPNTWHLAKMLKSTDGGSAWNTLSAVPDYLGGQGNYDTTLAVDPSNASVVYVGGTSNNGGPNIAQSVDGGTTWTNIGGGANAPHTDEHAMVFDKNGKLLSGSDGGIWRLENPTPGQIAWSNLNGDLNTIQFYGIALAPNDIAAYGGCQDNGTDAYSGNPTWMMPRGGDGGYVRVDFTNPNTIYHAYEWIGSGTIERSDDGGATWKQKTNGINPNDRADFILPYVMDPAKSSRLILGTDHVYETNDKGDNWTAIGTPGVNGFNPNGDVVSAVGVNGSTVYAVTLKPKVFVSFNDGASWSDVTMTGSGNWQISFDMTVDPNNNLHAFLVGYWFYGWHVLETKNGGTSWNDVTGNLGDVPTQAVRVDPNTGVVYIGTDIGVFSATIPGTWMRVGTGLPTVMVDSLDINPSLGLLAAGTFGRGLWVTSLGTGFQTPSVSSLSPNTASAGGAAFTLTVNGSNFANGALVQWGNSGIPTTFVSASQMTASVAAKLIATPGTVQVGVTNPGGQGSNTLAFTIGNGVPVLTSITPTSIDAGGPAFTLIIKGKNFVNGSTVNWDGSALTTTFVSPTQLTATVTASLIASPGKASVTVVTPGGGTSAAKPFTILLTSVTMTLAHLTRNSTTGVYTANITLKNTGYLSAPSVEVSAATLGTAKTTTTLPVKLGTLAAGSTVQTPLDFPGSAGTSGTQVTLKVTAKFTGGSTTTSLKVRLP